LIENIKKKVRLDSELGLLDLVPLGGHGAPESLDISLGCFFEKRKLAKKFTKK